MRGFYPPETVSRISYIVYLNTVPIEKQPLFTFFVRFFPHHFSAVYQFCGHYKVLRGAYFLQITDKHQFKEGYVESLSLDNGKSKYPAQLSAL